MSNEKELVLDIRDLVVHFEVDGDVIYFNFNTHETCKNFYNQDFEGDERQTAIHALVDLQNGTVTFLELPKEEE